MLRTKKPDSTDLSAFEKTFDAWTSKAKDKPSKKKPRLQPVAFRVATDTLAYEVKGKKQKKHQSGTIPLSLLWIDHNEDENRVHLIGPDKVVGLPVENADVLVWLEALRDHLRKVFNLVRGML